VNIGEDLFETGTQAYGRWQATGSLDQLEIAIRDFSRARYLPWRSLSSLPRCLEISVVALEQHQQAQPQSVRPDRDELIEVLTVLQALDDAATDTAWSYGQRGWHLMLRYMVLRSFTDLNDAVVDFKTALARSKRDDPQIYRRALNVAWACEERFDFTQARGQSFRTIIMDDPSLNLHLELTGPYDLVLPMSRLEPLLVPEPERAPPPPLALTAIKRNLANLLVKNATHSRARPADARASDLRRAVRLLEEALAESAPDPELEGTVLGSLEAALTTTLVTRDGQPLPASTNIDGSPDLDRRITRFERFDAAATNPELTARFRMTLAALLMRRGSSADDERAAEIYRTLATSPGDASAALSLQAAVVWATNALHRKQWREVIEANRQGSQRVQALMASQTSWLDKYMVTQEAGRLAAMAAYGHVELADCAEAVALLESGRALMLTAQLATPADVSDPVPDDVQVVYLLSTGDDAVALCSTGDGGWRAQPLEQLLPVDDMRRYLRELDGFRGDPARGVHGFSAAVSDVVGHLQRALAAVAGDVSHDADLVVIPVGALALFPVASALIDDAPTGRGVSVLPTRKLLTTDLQSNDAPPTGQLLLRDRSLPASGYEEQVVKGFFPEAISFPADVPKDALLDTLPSDGLVHFACHAEVRPRAPLSSAILLPNGETLTVSDLLAAGLPALRLVVLSACETGVPDPEAPDEVVSLAAALVANGAHGVISTLWPVEDLSTTLLVAHFYWCWRTLGIRPSRALGQAQRWQATTSDAEKIEFIRNLAKAGILRRDDADDMTDDLTRSGGSPSENRYAAPYFWAGFVFSGS
jgi:hypothetical protein